MKIWENSVVNESVLMHENKKENVLVSVSENKKPSLDVVM